MGERGQTTSSKWEIQCNITLAHGWPAPWLWPCCRVRRLPPDPSRRAGRSAPGDAYTQGKALTYQKLVCDSCPVQKGALDRERALSLKDSLEARDEADKPGTPDDDHIKVLDRDEQEMVHYFLTRRFRL